MVKKADLSVSFQSANNELSFTYFLSTEHSESEGPPTANAARDKRAKNILTWDIFDLRSLRRN